MLLKIGLPVAASCLLGLATVHMHLARTTTPGSRIMVAPSETPFANCVSGSGLVEARTETIALGAPEDGIVAEVRVQADQPVRAGDPVFRIDDRRARAVLDSRRAAVEVARAALRQLEEGPRLEAIPVKEARLREAEAVLAKHEDLLERSRRLQNRLAATSEELALRQFDCRAARERVAEARADLALLKAGAWEPDKALARARLAEAETLSAQAETELDRLTVRAPISGRILKVNARVGQRVGMQGPAPVVMGDVEVLHVRVDVDEADLPRFDANAPARAFVKGAPDEPTDLEFVRIEPEVVRKRSLTGSPDEQVDTRVLQVIYRAAGRSRRLYVGQQVDVFVAATARHP